MPTASKLSTDKLDNVKIRGTTLRKADVLQVLYALPDMAPLSTSESAIFLGYSVSQMERMRVSGNGPRYRQTPPMLDEEGAIRRGTNMAVTYRKLDLLEWAEKHTLTSAMEHAKLHGRTFATLMEVVEEVAFYVDESGAVESMVEENTVGTVIDRLGEWDIVWMSAAEGCGRAWSDATARGKLATAVSETLSKAQRSLASGHEATELLQASEGAPEAPVKKAPRRTRAI